MKPVVILMIFFSLHIISVTMDNNNDPDEDSVDVYSKCYDDLGCIETNSRWYDSTLRPVNLPPVDRHIIKTDFLLIKVNKSDSENLLYNSMMPKFRSVISAGYNNQSEVIILIHDFTANGYTGWIKHLAKIVLDNSPKTNVISVDWQRGAEPPYDQAISNGRVVALEIILLLKELKENDSLNFKNVHIVGHGVGAHIAGYVGTTFNNIKKITGLDPSGPRFEGLPDIVKLNPSDAKYVEVVHTDAYDSRSQGTRETMGHSDFFINNADNQPECPVNTSFPILIKVERNYLKGGEISPGCSHKRAFKYFIEAVSDNECVFLGIKCDSAKDFKEGKCTSCDKSNDTCRTFGLRTYTNSDKASYFLSTAGRAPYCMYAYKVTISIKGGGSDYHGYFDFILIDDKSVVSKASLADPKSDERSFKSDGSNTYVYYAQTPKLNTLKEVKIRWNERKKIYCFLYCKQIINVDKVTFKFLGTGKDNEGDEQHMCPLDNQTEIENGAYRTFTNCEKSETATSSTTTSSTTTSSTTTGKEE